MHHSFEVLRYPDYRVPMLALVCLWLLALFSIPTISSLQGWTHETIVAYRIVVGVGIGALFIGGILLRSWTTRFRTTVVISDRGITVGSTSYDHDAVWVRYSRNPVGNLTFLTLHTEQGEVPLVWTGASVHRYSNSAHYLGRVRATREELERIREEISQVTTIREEFLSRANLFMHPYG